MAQLKDKKRFVDIPPDESALVTLPRSWFDNKQTAVGCKGLSEYRWKKNVRLSSEDRAVFSNIPEHDWPSHASDGFRYGCIAIANNLRQGSMTPK